jgi:hypothetical protein
MQLNLNRSSAAHDLVMESEPKADVLIASEPNKKRMDKGGWYVDTYRDAAIKVLNRKQKVENSGRGKGYVWVEIDGVRIVSGYASPNIGIEEFKKYLGRLENCIRHARLDVLVAGDLNAKSPIWGSGVEDNRGAALADLLSANNMFAQNLGEKATFVGARGQSVIDITCATSGLAPRIQNWKVEDTETLSDHRLITYEIVGSSEKERKNKTSAGWFWKEESEEAFARELGKRVGHIREISVAALTKIINHACNSVLKKKNCGKNGRKPAYWWTPEIANTRAACVTLRRAMMRAKGNERNRELAAEKYRKARKDLKYQILKSKEKAWKKLVEDVDENPWGTGYKAAMGKFVRETPPTDAETREAVRKLFPNTPLPVWIRQPPEEVAEFDLKEIEAAANKLRPKKAPGPDGFSAEIVKATVRAVPDVILQIANGCLRERMFPIEWKRAKLALISKGKADCQGKRKFRPICLLDCLGKLMEHLIRARLADELEEKGGLSDAQYGFREGLSTQHAIEEVLKVARYANAGSWGRKDYCALITLDVENAFNTAPWAGIVEALRKRNTSEYLISLIQSYLTDRSLEVDEQTTIGVSCGVPQGSVLGPTLWNVLYDGVLGLELPEGLRLIAFADDLAVLVTAKTEQELMSLANYALERVVGWMEEIGLKLAVQKTEAVLLVGKRRPGNVKFQIGGEEILPATSLKYLGVRMDRAMTFVPHVEEVAAKAEKMVAVLGRIMPNMKGPGSSRRKLLSAVVHSRLLYGAAGWADGLKYKKNVETLNRVQRRVLVRVASAYRTVSAEALQVLTGVLPADLQAEGRVLLHRQLCSKEEVKKRQLRKWQARWQTTDKGGWTRKLLPEIATWIERGHGQLTYYLTQALSGHGCFASFLLKIGKEETDGCWFCGDRDDPEHTLFVCERWDRERLLLMRKTAEWPTNENFVEILLRSQADWDATAEFTMAVLRGKEDEERKREANGR